MQTLRLLHTSDWHLGHTLADWSREREHQAFLSWLLDTVEARRVDALLIAGDVFETSNPSAAALETWYRFLGDCSRRLPHLDVVVIGGNHDSASRLDAPNPLLVGSRLRVVGGLPRRAQQRAPDAASVVVPLVQGSARAWVCAVPFLRPVDLPEVEVARGDVLALGVRAVYDAVLAAARALRRDPGEPLVAMGHLYMVGGEVSELSERKVLGGNQHALPVDLFPSDVTYAALGHLHKAQRVGGRDHLRYCGSPLPLSMTEAGYHHQVLLVEFEGAGVSAVEPLTVPRGAELLRLGGDDPRGGLPLAEVVLRLQALPARGAVEEWRWPFVEVRVRLDAPEPALVRRVTDVLEDRAARLVRIERVMTGSPAPLARTASHTSLRDLTPETVFRRLYQREHAGEPEAELLATFHEALDAAAHEAPL